MYNPGYSGGKGQLMFFSTFSFLKCYLFIFGSAGSSLVLQSGLFSGFGDQGLFLVVMCGNFSLWRLLLLQSMGSRACGLQ